MGVEDYIRDLLAENPGIRVLAVVPTPERRQALMRTQTLASTVEAVTPGAQLLGKRVDVVVLEGKLAPEWQDWAERCLVSRIAPYGYVARVLAD